tara:strand:- start:2634 stop:2921 length:288 start_codon:yes stop_codon:yes gene_type:complete
VIKICARKRASRVPTNEERKKRAEREKPRDGEKEKAHAFARHKMYGCDALLHRNFLSLFTFCAAISLHMSVYLLLLFTFSFKKFFFSFRFSQKKK